LEEVDVGRLVDEALAGVEAHLAQRLGAARAHGHLGVRELDLVDLAAHSTSAPLTLGARGPPAGRPVVVGPSEVVAASWRVVLARRSLGGLLAEPSRQHAQQLEGELALGRLVLLGPERRARVPAQLRRQARQLAIEAASSATTSSRIRDCSLATAPLSEPSAAIAP